MAIKNNAVLILLKIAPLAFFLILWEIFIIINSNYEFFLGSPTGVFLSAKISFLNGSLIRDIGVTSFEAFCGFVFGSVIGTAIGLSLWYSRTVYEIARPYIITFGSIPVFAVAPILIFWFGTGILSKIVLGFLTTFIIAAVQAYNGAENTDDNLQKLLKVFGASRGQIFKKIIIPSSVIWVLAGIRINIGMALLGAFVGEFIASKMGLGHMIILAEGLYDVNQIWVGIIGIVIIALVFNLLTTPVEKWAAKWK